MRRYREGRCNPVSGWGHARLTAVVLTLLVTARLAIVGQPAEASTTPIPPPFFIPLLEKTDFKQADGAKVIISRSLSLQAGESRRVFGRVKATSTTTNTVEFDAGVRCLDSQGNQSGTAAWTGRNHEGYDTDSPYYPTKGQLPLTANLLFRAPTAGIYTCQLLAVKDEKKDPGWLTAIPSDGVGGRHLVADQQRGRRRLAMVAEPGLRLPGHLADVHIPWPNWLIPVVGLL
jgi:hypothetical protein